MTAKVASQHASAEWPAPRPPSKRRRPRRWRPGQGSEPTRPRRHRVAGHGRAAPVRPILKPVRGRAAGGLADWRNERRSGKAVPLPLALMQRLVWGSRAVCSFPPQAATS
ncbi:unnamed protein product [Phaeothamnion confervicola]